VAFELSHLAEIAAPVPEIEALLSQMTQSGAFEPHLNSVIVNAIGGQDLRCLATAFNHPTEGWLGTDQIGFTDLGTFPRKLSGCQYVVGSETMLCMRKSDPATAAKYNVVGEVGDSLPALMQADATVGAAMAEGGSFATLMEPAFLGSRPHLAAFMASLQEEGNVWNGAPVRFRGQVVATCCLNYLGLPNGEVGDALVQAQLKAVSKLEDIFERIAQRWEDEASKAPPLPGSPSKASSVGAVRTSATEAKDRVKMLSQISHDGSLSSMVGLPASPTGGKPPPSPPSRPPSLEAKDGVALSSLHQLSGRTLAGGTLEMSSLAGKAVVVVNTASK